jgi:Ser/Thr protein kinase RdoA (MazF antagonist)
MSCQAAQTSQSRLHNHLEAQYNLEIETIHKLDEDVYRVQILSPQKRCWVARVFHHPANAYSAVQSLLVLLDYLKQQGYPSEELAVDPSVSALTQIKDSSECVLVTKWVAGQAPERNRNTFYRLGTLLGKLHSLPVPSDCISPGGGWHHLNLSGGVTAEIESAISVIREVEAESSEGDEIQQGHHGLITELRKLQVEFSPESQLPVALTHPDLTPSNVISHASPDSGDSAPGSADEIWTIIDWAGAGIGPRIFSLGFLLAVATARGKMILVDAVLKGYRTFCSLEPLEIAHLVSAGYVRFLTMGCWEIGRGRKSVNQILETLPELVCKAEQTAERVRQIIQNS